jgi:hypothetical protein
MKITQKHLDILNAVRATHNPMRHKIVGLNTSKGRLYDSLVRFDYLQPYCFRGQLDDNSGSSSSGTVLVRLTSKGIAEIMEEAFALENRPMVERVAERVKGLSVPDLIEAGISFDTAIYSKVAAIMKDNAK